MTFQTAYIRADLLANFDEATAVADSGDGGQFGVFEYGIEIGSFAHYPCDRKSLTMDEILRVFGRERGNGSPK